MNVPRSKAGQAELFSKNLVTLCAFDLLELDGRDLRGQPIETRKAELAELLRGLALAQENNRATARAAGAKG